MAGLQQLNDGLICLDGSVDGAEFNKSEDRCSGRGGARSIPCQRLLDETIGKVKSVVIVKWNLGQGWKRYIAIRPISSRLTWSVVRS